MVQNGLEDEKDRNPLHIAVKSALLEKHDIHARFSTNRDDINDPYESKNELIITWNINFVSGDQGIQIFFYGL